DEHFGKKMFDFIKYDKFEVKDIPVMKFGRHFRLKDGAKLVIGRDREENQHLQAIENDKYYHIRTVGLPGPHSLLSKNASEDDKLLASRAILTYCKTELDKDYTLSFDGDEVVAKRLNSRVDMKEFSI
ncbi:MAG: ATP-binding protein, partial [Campylobacterales bacterium]